MRDTRAADQVLTVREIRVVDAAGTERITMRVSDDGTAEISIDGAAGDAAVVILENGNVARVFDHRGDRDRHALHVEDRLDRLDRAVEQLVIFAKACWAGASLLANEEDAK